MKELQSLDDVFNKRIFRIPDYQRGYAWLDKQLIDFWDDLISLDGSRYHYTGVLSIKEVPEEEWKKWNDESWLIEKRKYSPFYVVDGQQRLTTTSVFLQCLVEIIRELPVNKERGNSEILLGTYKLSDIIEKYLVIAQPPENFIKTYKFGYEVDNPSFQFLRYRIYNEPNSGKIDETFYTLNLENAKDFFRDNLLALIKDKGSNILEEIYEKLTQRFMFNVYEISDDFDVFVAFETMNNRGKKLSDLELLKNRLIYLTSLYGDKEVKKNDKKKIRDNINEAWREVYYQLGRNKNAPLNDNEFLRSHWIMYFKYSRKRGDDYIRFLLDEYFSPKKVLEKVQITTDKLVKIEEQVDHHEADDDDIILEEESNGTLIAKLQIGEINTYVLSLKSAARHWYNIFHPLSNDDITDDEGMLLDRLNRIGIGYFRPLVMSSYTNEEISSENRIKLFSAIERFIFIAFRLSRAQYNYRNSSYYLLARDLYKGETTIEDILHLIEEDMAWAKDTQGVYKFTSFRDMISRKFKSEGTGFYGWNGVRYFLYEYEEELKKIRGVPKISWKNFVRHEKDKVSIEHIYPQTATDPAWIETFKDFSDEEKKYLTGTLGNLLPLSSLINSSLQNDEFQSKKNTKKNSDGTIIRNGYSNGSYSEQEVAHKPSWTAAEIKERGLKLLKFLEKRWNVNLGSEKDKLDLLHIAFLNSDN
jgi:uncharacterized protein with ParB-like and HNH nuclease domain